MKTVTITKDEFIDKSTDIAAEIVSSLEKNGIDSVMCEATISICGALTARLVTAFFGKEEENDI